MKHRIESRYAVPPDVIRRMFADPAFHIAKLEALGLQKYRVLDQGVQGEEFRIRIERKVPLDAPALVKKVVPAETTAVSEEIWNTRSGQGRVRIEPGVPVDMSCEAQITGDARSCVVSYLWDVRARVPLIGGALEKFICSDLEAKMRDETRAATGLLGRYT